jgi:hypothetical protein
MANNLIDELSPAYCNDMLRGAMFLMDKTPHQFQQVDEGQSNVVACRRFSDNPDRVTTKNVPVPKEFFKGWSALEFPILGYRMAANGQILAYVTRENSVRRGLHPEDARVDLHDVSYECGRQFGLGLDHYTHGNGKIPLILCPTYLPFGEGLAKILAGEIPAFALSADFAVAPNPKVPFLEVLYRQRRIGTIDETGKTEITTTNILPSWKNVSKET